MPPAGTGRRKQKHRIAAPRSQPLGDDYLLCPASGLVHPPAYLPIMNGPKQLFARCPIERCRSVWYMSGIWWRQKYERDGQIGLTREEIAEKNPMAQVF